MSSKATGKALPLELEGRGVEKALEVSEVVEFGRVVVGRVGIQTLALANRTDGELDYALSLEDGASRGAHPGARVL